MRRAKPKSCAFRTSLSCNSVVGISSVSLWMGWKSCCLIVGPSDRTDLKNTPYVHLPTIPCPLLVSGIIRTCASSLNPMPRSVPLFSPTTTLAEPSTRPDESVQEFNGRCEGCCGQARSHHVLRPNYRASRPQWCRQGNCYSSSFLVILFLLLFSSLVSCYQGM